jgi:hypothetical protein
VISTLDSLPFAPEPNAEVLRSLKQIDERLGLRYLPIGEGCWAITEKWGEDDKRRARVRSGEIPPSMDFDVLGFASEELLLEDAVGMLTHQLRAKVTNRPEYQSMLDRCILQNKLQSQENISGTREFAHELFAANEENMGAKIISRGAGFTIENGRAVGTPHKPRMGLTKSEREASSEMSDK